MLHRYITLAALAVCIVLALLVMPPTRAQNNERCFAETEFCIAGRLLAFWEQNGGLAIFGYPITAQGEAVIDGQTLQVQWFERNRLELHPENAPPYDVLLGRLGVDVLEQQARNWQQFPRDDEPAEGCRFFAESGQNLCGEFLSYWQAAGLDLDLNGQSGENERENLALFGLPISRVQTETLSDGREYTVQWFERARLELHPENPAEFRVLPGLLGSEIRAAGSTPTPTAGPTVAPTAIITATATPAAGPTTTALPTTAAATPPPGQAGLCFEPVVPSDASNRPLRIVEVDKIGEVVTLENDSDEVVDLAGWTLCSVRGNEMHLGLRGFLEPGEMGEFTHTGEESIWSNNEPDDAMLFQPDGRLISYWDDPVDN